MTGHSPLPNMSMIGRGSDFDSKMNQLYVECNSLEDQESASLKLMIKVGQKSLEYWEKNLQKWSDHFSRDENLMVKRGAGPAGAVAGGLVVGGTFSAARIIAGAIFNRW